MVRISTFAIIFAAISSAAADKFCQCLYQDGSHCCVIDSGIGAGCQARCGSATVNHKACNAGGKYSKVSLWNGNWRTKCDQDGLLGKREDSEDDVEVQQQDVEVEQRDVEVQEQDEQDWE